eukprot:scaffold328500_cov53-Tisochrysis_lutea.AAC.1
MPHACRMAATIFATVDSCLNIIFAARPACVLRCLPRVLVKHYGSPLRTACNTTYYSAHTTYTYMQHARIDMDIDRLANKL